MANAARRMFRVTRWKGVLAALLLCAAIPAFGDDAPFLSQLKSLNLDDGEVQGLEDVVLATYQSVMVARAEVTADRAVLTRQLLLPSVTLKDLEPTVRHSINAELKIRLAELDRQLKIRKLLGDKRWALLMDLSAGLKKQTVAPDGLSEDSQTNRILHVLRILGS